MSARLLLLTHEDIGAQMSRVARAICGQSVEPVAAVSIPSDLEPADLGNYADRVRDAMRAGSSGDGVPVLTAACGATPDYLARYFPPGDQRPFDSGINLPMLLRVLNYAHQPLGQLCETALVGGRTGVRKDRQ